MEVGQVFNYLKIVEVVSSRKSHCLCECVCGVIKEIYRSQVKLGRTKSCGCMRSKMISAKVKTHGKSKSKIYDVYLKMIDRCYKETDKGFINYGGRGIKVCDRWLESFENFLEDMGEPPEKHSIDRENNNLGYSKENCRWVDRTTQNANRRKLVGSRKTTSTHPGVHKSGKGWRTTIYRYGNVVYDKYAKTEEQAIQNYLNNIEEYRL